MSGILLTRHAVPKIGCLSPGSTDVCPPKNNPPSLFMEKGPGDEVSSGAASAIVTAALLSIELFEVPASSS